MHSHSQAQVTCGAVSQQLLRTCSVKAEFCSGQRGGLASLRRLSRRTLAQRRGCCQIRAAWTDVAGVLVVSAIPFLALQALAESDLGDRLEKNVVDAKPRHEEERQQYAAAAQDARIASPWFGPERPKWLGPLPHEYADWLPEEAAGNYGFDVARLSQPEGKFDRYFELELLHARWAMLGMLGAVIPELLQRYASINFAEPVWWRVGAAKAAGEDLNYLGVGGLRIAGGQGIFIIAVCQVLLMYGPEYARSCGINSLEPLGVYLPGDKNYPGGWAFDPFNFATDPAKAEELKVKEIKNGRLAMVAWVGFFAQGALTKQGPITNFFEFLEDPARNNLVSNLDMLSLERVADLSAKQ